MTDAVLWLAPQDLTYTGKILTLGDLRTRASCGPRRATAPDARAARHRIALPAAPVRPLRRRTRSRGDRRVPRAPTIPSTLPLAERLRLVARFLRITNHVRTYHTQAEMLTVADRVLRLAGRPGLTVLEAGAGKGGGTAKLSLVARLAGARLVVCDSFRGMPPNEERHENDLGTARPSFARVRFGARRGSSSGRSRASARPRCASW